MSTEEKWDNTVPINTALESFIEKLKDLYAVYRAKNFPNSPVDEFEVRPGSRYIKVVHKSWGSRSVFCFIDTTNGNVLKAQSWAKPDLKNPRGNLFSEQNGLEAIEQKGMHPHIKYLR